MTSASSTDSVSAMNVPNPALPDSIPPSVLASADLLVTKTAYLAGMVAAETTACLSKLLIASDPDYSRIIDGYHTVPEVLKDARSLESQESTLGIPELRRCIVAALAHHYHLLHTQPLPEGNGVGARMILHRHLSQLGLQPQLWSLSRGLARRQEEYHASLATPHRSRESGIDGTQLPGKASITFIQFMLHVCHAEVDYMTAAMTRRKLREAVLPAFRTSSRLQEMGVSQETAPAFLALLIQGALPRVEFETFTGLQPEEAYDQLNRLISVGLVVSPSSNVRRLEVGLPVWFAEYIFPDLH